MPWKKCEPGCTCGLHKSARKGKSLPESHRIALKCPEGCECKKHTSQNSGQFGGGRSGRELGGGAKKGWKGTPDERFAAKVAADPSTGCHLWTGALTTAGYGSFRVDGRTVYAHAYIDERERGPLPEGLNRDHTCRVRRCVNLEHIERVTPAENNRRAVKVREQSKERRKPICHPDRRHAARDMCTSCYQIFNNGNISRAIRGTPFEVVLRAELDRLRT